MSEIALAPAGYGKTDSFRADEGMIWAAVLADFFGHEILLKGAVRVGTAAATGAGGGALAGAAGAGLLNLIAGKKVVDPWEATKGGAQLGGAIGGATGVIYHVKQVEWSKLAEHIGMDKVVPAVKNAVDALQIKNTAVLLDEFGCSTSTSRTEFNSQFRKKIQECERQEAKTAKINKMIYDARADAIRSWYDSKGEY